MKLKNPFLISKMGEDSSPYYNSIKTLDELLERDKQRVKDGFAKKIRLGKIVKPGKNGKVVIVPTTIEEKLYHDNRREFLATELIRKAGVNLQTHKTEEETTGTSKEDIDTVLGERPVAGSGCGESGAGDAEGVHDIETNAVDMGKMLTEKFALPNLEDKGKKKSLTKFTYDLTDRNRGSGQVIDKKRTLMQIIKTNIALKRINIKSKKIGKLLINPHDYIYRTLSRERDNESQAMVFFLRDYSYSMEGKPTELVCQQHLFLYFWLMYQYQSRVETRFILHDMIAKEVPNFDTYYNMNVNGGTEIQSGLDLVNEIVRDENLAKDYNIYVFYGSDGEDWCSDPDGLVNGIENMLSYANRFGITIIKDNDLSPFPAFQQFIHFGGFLEAFPKKIRMNSMGQNVGEDRLIEGIKALVSED